MLWVVRWLAQVERFLEAHEESKLALVELRDLARGIPPRDPHPPGEGTSVRAEIPLLAPAGTTMPGG